MTPKIKIMDWN